MAYALIRTATIIQGIRARAASGQGASDRGTTFCLDDVAKYALAAGGMVGNDRRMLMGGGKREEGQRENNRRKVEDFVERSVMSRSEFTLEQVKRFMAEEVEPREKQYEQERAKISQEEREGSRSALLSGREDRGGVAWDRQSSAGWVVPPVLEFLKAKAKQV
tara:strand:- start:45 stop:533 length:489 start_codon:yes stop_codon:yes gene_type:complete